MHHERCVVIILQIPAAFLGSTKISIGNRWRHSQLSLLLDKGILKVNCCSKGIRCIHLITHVLSLPFNILNLVEVTLPLKHHLLIGFLVALTAIEVKVEVIVN